MKKPNLKLNTFAGIVDAAARKPDAEIALNLIDTKPQVRSKLGDLADLAESIKRDGVMQPIILRELDNGRYELIAGERRFRASLLAGKATIPAIIKRGISDAEARRIQVIENHERENLSAYDEARGVAEDVEKFGFQEARNIWNRSDAWISKRAAVVKYHPEVFALLEAGLCGDLEVLHSLNQLRALDVAEFVHFERRLREGLPLSRDEARNRVTFVREHKKEQKELADRRAAAAGQGKVAPKGVPAEKNEVPKWLKDKRTKDEATAAGKKVPATKRGDYTAPSQADVTPEAELSRRKRLEYLRKEVFKAGADVGRHAREVSELMVELGLSPDDAEWVFWNAFRALVLPMFGVLNEARGKAYLARIQTELKNAGAAGVYIDPAESRPADWRF